MPVGAEAGLPLHGFPPDRTPDAHAAAERGAVVVYAVRHVSGAHFNPSGPKVIATPTWPSACVFTSTITFALVLAAGG